MYTKKSSYTNYGKGYPGYAWEVSLFLDGRRVAYAFGPNVNGPCIGEFRDMDAVRRARQLPDGPISADVDVPALLADYYAKDLIA